MAVRKADVKPGDKLEVAAFTAKVIEARSDGSTVLVEREDGARAYVYYSQLSKVLPYRPGARYIGSGSSTVYTFTVNGDGTPQWTTASGTVREFDYPTRPMRLVTVSSTPVEE